MMIKKDDLACILVLTIPFVVGAALEFLPAWISVPITFSLGILWLGSAATLKST